MALTEKYRFGLLSAAGLRQQDLGQSINLLEGSVPEEQAGFEHFQLNDAPAVVGVSKEVDPGVGPRSWSDGDGPLGDIQDLWRRCPSLVFRAKIILNPVIPGTGIFCTPWDGVPPQYSTENSPSTMTLGQKGCKSTSSTVSSNVAACFWARADSLATEKEGSTGGGANSRFEEGLISAKIFGLLDGFEAIWVVTQIVGMVGTPASAKSFKYRLCIFHRRVAAGLHSLPSDSRSCSHLAKASG